MIFQKLLLTRDQFREAVFKRDDYRCVICKEPAQDAHHILERRLWADGGYYLANGASVCGPCHIKCETTEISVEEVRIAAWITKKILPDHLYEDTTYTKWGDVILANGQRLRGELFYDESVQKILAQGNKLDLYTNRVKYGRTYHVPWSDGMNDDDRMLKNMDHFVGKRVIVTEKMDGENFTGYNDGSHARSVDGRSHASRNWVKNFWSSIKHDVPDNWRVCGENLFAKHAIPYELETYFLGFSVWNDRNVCLSWDDTLIWFNLLGITPVKVLYDGIYDEKKIRSLYNDKMWSVCEGYVVRVADSFSYGEFRKSVGKFVRKNHVTKDSHHWRAKEIIPNKLVA